MKGNDIMSKHQTTEKPKWLNPKTHLRAVKLRRPVVANKRREAASAAKLKEVTW
jgi:hypothetical protein